MMEPYCHVFEQLNHYHCIYFKSLVWTCYMLSLPRPQCQGQDLNPLLGSWAECCTVTAWFVLPSLFLIFVNPLSISDLEKKMSWFEHVKIQKYWQPFKTEKDWWHGATTLIRVALGRMTLSKMTISGLCYKHMTIVNYDSSIVSEQSF